DDTFNVPENNGPTKLNVLANDDFGGDGPSSGTILIVTPPANGTAVGNDNATPNDPTDDYIVYTPNVNYNRPDTFTFKIVDSNCSFDTATVKINVTLVNDFPDAKDDAISLPEDNGPTTLNVLANDTFGNDGPGVGPIMIVTGPTYGTAVVNDNGTPSNPL